MFTNKILNLTQHPATPEQIAAGVYEPDDKEVIQNCLTFETIPQYGDILLRAKVLALYAYISKCTSAMIGGAGYLMGPLETALIHHGILPLYAFSQRDSVEVPQPDGSVKKTAIFKHVGFVGADRFKV